MRVAGVRHEPFLLTIADSAGRELSGLLDSRRPWDWLAEGCSAAVQRSGPLLPGTYPVTATSIRGARGALDVAVRGPGTLDVELAFRIEKTRSLAWYSPKGWARPLSRLLVDDDEDAQADRRHEWRDGAWHEESSEAAWLTTEHMDWDWNETQDYDARVRTIRAVAAFGSR